MPSTTRRAFLEQTGKTATAAAAASAMVWSQTARAADAERMPIALIGPGGMGTSHLKLLAARQDVKLEYLCDVDSNRLAVAAKTAASLSGSTPKTVKDLRQVLDDKSVQAVWIATPDHWHAPATILACEAGKHVYVEKPCSHNVREGRLMIEAARKHDRVVQMGAQSRSTAHVREAMEKLKAGAIGDVLVAKAWNSQRRSSIGHAQPSEPPAHLDYDLWVGPAPMRPYQANLLPGIWRWWHDFGAGDMGNDGVHDIDIARWGLGVETHPSTIVAHGGKFFFDDDQQFPDTQYVVFEYPGDGQPGHRRQLVFEQRIWSPYKQEGFENGDAFYGTEGMLILGKKEGYKIYGRKNKLIEEVNGGPPNLAAHHQNFLNCIRQGGRPHADIEIGHLSSSLCHLGNIATRVGRVIHFDPDREQVTGGDAEAARLVSRQYREGHWATPRGV